MTIDLRVWYRPSTYKNYSMNNPSNLAKCDKQKQII